MFVDAGAVYLDPPWGGPAYKEQGAFRLRDFDPDGDAITETFARSMRDDFGLKNVHPIKVALTADDVRDHALPSDMDAKPSSPNYKKFLAKYGTKAVELDAAPVRLLQMKLRHAIESASRRH